MIDETSFLILGLVVIYLYMRKKRETDREDKILSKIERYLDKVMEVKSEEEEASEEVSEETSEEEDKEEDKEEDSPFTSLIGNKMSEKDKEQLAQLSKVFTESLVNVAKGDNNIPETLKNMFSSFVHL